MDNAPSVTVRRVSYFLRAASAIGLKGNPPWGITLTSTGSQRC